MPSKYWRSCTTPHGSRALCWRLPKSLWLNRLTSLRKWWKLPSGKLTVRPWQIGLGRLVSINNWLFSGSLFIYHRVVTEKVRHWENGGKLWCLMWLRKWSDCLTGGFNQPLWKNMSSLVGIMTFTIYVKKTCSNFKPPTSDGLTKKHGERNRTFGVYPAVNWDMDNQFLDTQMITFMVGVRIFISPRETQFRVEEFDSVITSFINHYFLSKYQHWKNLSYQLPREEIIKINESWWLEMISVPTTVMARNTNCIYKKSVSHPIYGLWYPMTPFISIYTQITVISGHTLRLFNVAIEHGPFIVDLPFKSGDYP